MKKLLEFNEEKHEYKLGGIIVPSVSHILRANGLQGNFRHNETKITNGTAIHKALELHNLGKLDYQSLDNRLKKCIDLWEKFRKALGLEVLAVEERVNMGVLYAGTIDTVCKAVKSKVIIDYKSGVPQDWAALQTAAYAMAYDPKNYADYERYCLQLHWDMDTVKYKPHKDKNDFQTFLSMANTYHWKKNHGYLEEENGNN